MDIRVKPASALKGELTVGADKSISHRAVIFSALSKGKGIIKNFLKAEDTLSTCRCMQQLGADVELNEKEVVVIGRGLSGLREPASVLDCGNSGTTMRLLTGLLSAQPFFSVLIGDASLSRRPMKRVIEPLLSIGAQINGRNKGSNPPLAITGSRLKGINYRLPVASAQVKTALLLAGLAAEGDTVLLEPEKSRDHSERMLKAMGADIEVDGLKIELQPGKELYPQEFLVPGDISSAAFFMVAAALIPGSELMIRDVGVNPSRSGVIDVLQKMGTKIKLENRRVIGGEPVADIIVSSSELKAIDINKEIIPCLIDELPVLAVAMAAARGESRVSGAGELRVKETDRIAAICSELGKMGAGIQELEDGFIVKGKPEALQGCRVDSHEDHRIAMSLAVAALGAGGETVIENAETVNISFPSFWNKLSQLTK
ncbi:MAG: 3-phosphoshikimate 1-carboxyvinyltransferase [Syntrophomonas sp.]